MNNGELTLVQQISILAEYGCTYSIHTDERSEKFSDVHALTITKNGTVVGGQSIKKEIINYSGKIYCVQVPSGMLLVRRNKRAIVCGNSGHPPEVVWKLAHLLADAFGYTYNSKGYKVLNHVRILQGDGINRDSMEGILAKLRGSMFSADNIVFGMGGGLL